MTDNDYSEKFRAVFLTALMIGSVFGAGIAFTGSAAAGSLGVTIANDEVGETTTYTANYEVGSGNSDVGIQTIKFDTDGATTLTDVDDEDVTLQVRGEEVAISDTDNGGPIEVSLKDSVDISTGDKITLEVADVGNPATTDSQTASLSLFTGDGTGDSLDSGSAGYSSTDTVPSISEFSAEHDGEGNVNVSFVSDQELDNGTTDNISVYVSPESSDASTSFNSSDYEGERLDNGDFLYYQEDVPGEGDGVYTATLVKAIDNDVDKQDAADGQTTSVTVDTSSPVFDGLDPDEGADLTSVPDSIRVEVNDSLTKIDEDSIRVTLSSDSGSYTFVDNVGVTKDNDGIGFEYAEGDETTGNVTIVPDDLPVKSFPDGDIQVNVSASDAAGNSNATDAELDSAEGEWKGYDFQLDTGANFEFTLEEPEDGDGDGVVLTKNDDQEVIVGHSGEGTTFDYANLTISNGTETWSYTSDDNDLNPGSGDVYNASSDTFNISADSDNLPALTDGTYTITVNATDTFGNTAEDTTYTLNVDTQAPKTDDVSISGAGADEVFNNEEAASAQIDVAFNETVTAATVKVDTDGGGSFDGDEPDATLSSSEGQTSWTTEVDLSGTDIDVEDASVNVTSVTDVAGNTNGTDTSTVFAVDTELPSHTNDITGALDAYEDLTNHVSDLPDDKASVTYHIKPKGESTYTEITDPEHFDPSQYDDDVYNVSVNVTDDAGNMVSETTEPYVDLESPSVTSNLEDQEVLSGSVNLEEAFSVENNDSSVDWDYEADDGSGFTSITSSYDLPASTDGTTVELKAIATESSGATDSVTTTVTVVADDVEVTGHDLSQSNEDLQAVVETDEKVDTLEATVRSTDNFRSEVSTNLALSEFGSPQETDSGNWQYTYNVSDVRDGQYELNVTAAANGSRNTVTDLGSPEVNDITLDNGNATLVDAVITDADDTDTTVELRFDEPVADSIHAGDVSFDGQNADGTAGPDRQSETGTVEVQFSGTIQTGDLTDINASSITEEHGSDDADSSTTLHTIELSLDEGWNAVSVPAASGSVDASELGDNVEVVWTYDASDESWTAYNPDDSTDSLSLEGGEGYLVKMSSDDTVDLNVENKPSGQQAPNEQDISEGWNLVGHYQEGSQAGDIAFSTMQTSRLSSTNEIVDSAYSQSSSGELTFTSQALGTDLTPGEAYWVWVQDDTSYAESGWS